MTEEKVPQVGDPFLYQDDEGEFQDGTIATVEPLDDEDGLFPITSKAGGSFRVYWSDDDDSWIDEGE